MRKVILVFMVVIGIIIGFTMQAQAGKIDPVEFSKYLKMGRDNQNNAFYLLPEIQKTIIGDKLRKDHWGMVKGPLTKAAIIAHKHPKLSDAEIKDMIKGSCDKISIFFSAKGLPVNVEVMLYQDGFEIRSLHVRDSRIGLKGWTNKEFDFFSSEVDISREAVVVVWINRVREVAQVVDLSQIK